MTFLCERSSHCGKSCPCCLRKSLLSFPLISPCSRSPPCSLATVAGGCLFLGGLPDCTVAGAEGKALWATPLEGPPFPAEDCHVPVCHHRQEVPSPPAASSAVRVSVARRVSSPEQANFLHRLDLGIFPPPPLLALLVHWEAAFSQAEAEEEFCFLCPRRSNQDLPQVLRV